MGMKKVLSFNICLIILLFSAAVAPVAHSQTVTVNEVKNLPQDSWVILRGNIVNV